MTSAGDGDGEAVLSLGSNLPPRERWLDGGLAALVAGGATILASSPRWHTRAVGPLPQPDFLNQVVRARGLATPEDWLRLAQEAEAGAGRRRGVPQGPRTLDVDLLACGALTRDTAELRLPHPAILERAFALRGLALVAPGWRHPGTGRSYGALATAAGLRVPPSRVPPPAP